jgi:hypothetical protein
VTIVLPRVSRAHDGLSITGEDVATDSDADSAVMLVDESDELVARRFSAQSAIFSTMRLPLPAEDRRSDGANTPHSAAAIQLGQMRNILTIYATQ